MNTKTILQQILRYYDLTRGVGHTRLMLEGTAYPNNGIIITHIKEYGEKVIKPRIAHGCIRIESLNSLDSLLGRKEAIVFDNYALYVLLNDVYREMNKLEQENNKLKFINENFKKQSYYFKNKLDLIKGIINNKEWTVLGKLRKMKSVLNR